MKQPQVRDFADDIEPDDIFGADLALRMVNDQIDNHMVRLETASLLLAHIDNVTDCTGGVKRRYDPLSQDVKLFDALVIAASIMPAEEMEHHFEIAERMENFLFLDMDEQHQQQKPEFLKSFQNEKETDLRAYHTKRQAFSERVTSAKTTSLLDYNFWDSPTAAVCDVYQIPAGSRDVKRKIALGLIS